MIWGISPGASIPCVIECCRVENFLQGFVFQEERGRGIRDDGFASDPRAPVNWKIGKVLVVYCLQEKKSLSRTKSSKSRVGEVEEGKVCVSFTTIYCSFNTRSNFSKLCCKRIYIYIYIRYSVLISELSKLSRGYAQLFSDSLFYIDCVNDTLNRRSVTAKLPLITMRIEKEESIESFLSNF